MALDAGSVYTTLGGRLDTSGFRAFTSATYKAKADMEASERGIVASQGRMAKAAKVTGLAVGAAAVGGAVIFVKETIKAVKVAGEFDQELRRLGARSDVTHKQMKKIRQASLDIGTSMGVGARQAAKGSTELIKGGLSVQKLLAGGLKGALALAVAGEMDVAEAAETTANALNLFKLKGEEAEHVADALATAANATTADVKDMAVALTQGGAAAKTAGLSFDETVAFLETLATAGVKGSDAGTSMKTALTQLAKPTKEASDLMGQLGLDFFDAQGNIKPLPALAGMLRDKLGGLTKEQRLQAATTLAGTDGMRALLALYDAGPKQVEKFQRGLKEQGTAAKVAAEQNEGAVGAAKKLGAAWEQAQIIFGEAALPALADAAETLTEKLQQMADDGSLARMGQDVGDLATALADELPAGIDQIEKLFGFFDDAGNKVDKVKEIYDVMDSIGSFLSPVGWTKNMISAINDPVDTMVASVEKALGAVKLLAEGIDKITPGDQSGIVKSLEETIGKVKALRRDLKNSDLDLGLKFDQESADKIYELAGKLGDMGKRDVAIRVTAATDDADAKIAALEAAIAGVPEKRILNIIARSQSAGEQVAAFNALVDGVPPRKVTTIQAKAKTAQAAILAFQAIQAGVPESKVTKVLAETNSARGQINGIIGLINSVPSSKTSTITVTTRNIAEQINRVIQDPGSHQIRPRKRAAGRGAVGAETALIGEGGGPEWRVDADTGRAYKTQGPELAQLGDRDYVIPTEDRYRGRALGLLAMLAADLGVPGYKKGRPGKGKKGRFVPPKLNAQAYSVDQFEDRETAAENAWKKAGQLRKNLTTARASLRDIERRAPKTAAQRQNKTEDLKRQHGRIKDIEADLKKLPEHGNEARLRAVLTQRRKELATAKRHQASIAKQEELAEIARDQMSLADKRDDQGAFDRAQSDYKGALGKLKGLLGTALGFAQAAGNDDFIRDLQKQLGQVDLSLEDVGAPMESAALEAAERLADTGMTDAERAQLQGIDKDIALAALTQTLDDDKGAAARKVDLLQGILDAALADPARGGAPAITELAGQLKSAQENLASFTGGSANDNQDLQAQLEQERERTRVSNEDAEVSRQALKAFEGWSAGPGAGTVINISTLHPGDSQTLSAIAQASNAGNDVTTIRRATTIQVGP